MSDIEPVRQQNSETPVIVNQDEFTMELQKYYSGHKENSKKLGWTNQRIQSVIKLLDEYNTIKSQGGRLTGKHYHHAKKYDVMNIGNRKVLVMKRKDISDPVLQIIPTEEYYQTILDAHIATGHGRRDKIVHAFKDKYVVPTFAVTIFLNLCKTCLSKKTPAVRQLSDQSFPKKGIVKPLISEDFHRTGQIDLTDFQTTPDQEYKWLLQYQDHLTKFCFLRPLKSKEVKEVAIEILKIFLKVGCPHILKSDDGREFTASVLKEIVNLWPTCKIVNGNKERSNQDIKNMIRAWMTDNKSTNWSFGCYFVQFQKNSSYHSTISRTPYKALFGQDPKLGVSSTYLSKNSNEEDQNSEKDQAEEEHLGNEKMRWNVPLLNREDPPTRPDQTKAIIAKVYHYFAQEYEELRKIYLNLDLTPLSKFTKRTALATGVSETTVLDILQEEQERKAANNDEPPQKRRRAPNKPGYTESSHGEDSSDDNDDDDEHSENVEEVETDSEIEPQEIKIEPPDEDYDKVSADPLAVKVEPPDDEQNNSNKTLARNEPGSSTLKGKTKQRPKDVTLRHEQAGPSFQDEIEGEPDYSNKTLARNKPIRSKQKGKTIQKPKDVTLKQQHRPQTTKSLSGLRHNEEFDESSLLGDRGLKLEIEIDEEGFS